MNEQVFRPIQFEEKECLSRLKEEINSSGSNLTEFKNLFTDRFLLHFVRGRKCNSQVAFKTLEKYVSVRTKKYRRIFVNYTPSEIECYRDNAFQIFKHPSPEGNVVLATRIEWWPPVNPSWKNPMEFFIKKLVHLTEEAWNYEAVEKFGLQIIFDLRGLEWQYVKVALVPSDVYMFIDVFHGAMPLRYGKVHLLNAPTIFKQLYRLLKGIIPSHLMQRVVVHSKEEDLLDHFPPSILPLEWGGEVEVEAYEEEIYENLVKPEKDLYYKEFNMMLGLTE